MAIATILIASLMNQPRTPELPKQQSQWKSASIRQPPQLLSFFRVLRGPQYPRNKKGQGLHLALRDFRFQLPRRFSVPRSHPSHHAIARRGFPATTLRRRLELLRDVRLGFGVVNS